LGGQQESSDFIDTHGVDLRLPLYPQVARLGNRYFDWVHTPVRKSTLNKLRDRDQGRWPGSVRIFELEWLEVMTHIPWQVVLTIWVPIVTALAAVAKFKLGMPWGHLTGFWLLGILVWTLVEYLLHRYHKAHHHRDPDALFGVSSPLWDRVFRTGSSFF